MPDEIAQCDPTSIQAEIRLNDRLTIRFSATLESTASTMWGGTMLEMDTWQWVAGRAVLETGENAWPGEKLFPKGFTDIMRGRTLCRHDYEHEVVVHLMMESWIINHEGNWAYATTEGERDLTGRVLPAYGWAEQAETLQIEGATSGTTL